MPELYSRAIKKWTADYSNSAPTIDFSNGVRIGDVAIDSSQFPNIIWRCYDNTIGNPVWKKYEDQQNITILDNDINKIIVGNVNSDIEIILTYVLTGGQYHHNGSLKISCDGTNVIIEEEFGGINPIDSIVISASIDSDNIIMIFDTTNGVGQNLGLVYNIINRLNRR